MQNIVVIDPVSSGIDFIGAAREMGLNVIVVSADAGERELSDELRKQVVKVIKCDTYQYPRVLEYIKALENVVAVLPGIEYHVGTCAKVSAELGLHGLNLLTAQIVRDKYKFREFMLANQFNSPRFATIKLSEVYPLKDLIPASFEFPAVVKPVDMAGSMGVVKVENIQALEKTMHELREQVFHDEGHSAGGNFILEEYITGDEFSVEGVVDENGIHILSVTEKILGPEPYFIEMGHIIGQSYENHFYERIADYATTLVHKLNLNVGPFHLELRVTKNNEPIAIEIAARLPGDKIVDLIKTAKGFDMAKMTIAAFLQLPTYVDHAQLQQEAAIISAIAFIPGNGDRTFSGVKALDKFSNIPEVVSSHLYHQEGDVLSERMDFTSRVGHLMLEGSCYQSIKQAINLVSNEAYSI